MSYEVDWPTRVLIQDLDQTGLFTHVKEFYPLNRVQLHDDGIVVLYSSFEDHGDEIIVQFYADVSLLTRKCYIAMSWEHFVARAMNGGSGMWGARVRGGGTGWTIKYAKIVGPVRETLGPEFTESMRESLPLYSERDSRSSPSRGARVIDAQRSRRFSGPGRGTRLGVRKATPESSESELDVV